MCVVLILQVLVVKTHEWGPQAERKFQKVILLVRDPAKSIVAEFNRQSGGHVGHASQDRYKRTKGKCKATTYCRKLPNHNVFFTQTFQIGINLSSTNCGLGNKRIWRGVVIFLVPSKLFSMTIWWKMWNKP
jgi:hypothetical protein